MTFPKPLTLESNDFKSLQRASLYLQNYQRYIEEIQNHFDNYSVLTRSEFEQQLKQLMIKNKYVSIQDLDR